MAKAKKHDIVKTLDGRLLIIERVSHGVAYASQNSAYYFTAPVAELVEATSNESSEIISGIMAFPGVGRNSFIAHTVVTHKSRIWMER
jgi:hypothetical protein